MSWKIRTDAIVTPLFLFFPQSRKVRSQVSCRQRPCTHGQIENDQLAIRTRALSKLCYKIVLYKLHKVRDLLDARR